jgi:hypothetical protein
MITKSLHFGKALSAALLVILLAVGTTKAFAQTQVATLQHGDDVSVFYGTNALVQAHDVASTGDIITLSSGEFKGTTITKAITLRGAGCFLDTITGISPTSIRKGYDYSMKLDIADLSESFTMEGIMVDGDVQLSNLHNAKFVKCGIHRIVATNQNADVQYVQFVDCIISFLGDYYEDNVYMYNVQFYNCFVVLDCDGITYENSFAFTNCVAMTHYFDGILAQNTILFGGSTDNPNSLFYNCVSIGYTGGNYFSYQTNDTNLHFYSFSDVFESFPGCSWGSWGSLNGFSWNERYVLKPDFAASFLGTDGTQVGIYGGLAPYNPRPNYMVMKRANVANQSTVDGKLSVEIEVVTEGE